MAELVMKVPDKIKETFDSEGIDLMEFLMRAMESKEFELEFKRSTGLQRSVIELLASRSKLTEREALKLGDRVNESALRRMKARGWV